MQVINKLSGLKVILLLIMHNLLLWIVYYFVQKIFIFFNKTSYGSVSKYFNWEFENLGVFLFRLALALIYWDFILMTVNLILKIEEHIQTH